MSILNAIFQNIVFTKTETANGYDVYYAAVVSSYTGGKGRYIILFVPESMYSSAKANIQNLNWYNLQTRELIYSFNLPKQSWNSPSGIDDTVHITERTLQYSTFRSETDHSYSIKLLHNPKKASKYQYYNKMTLTGALNTFNCVITLENLQPSTYYEQNYELIES